MRIEYGKKFSKQYKNAPLAVRELFKERVRIFSQDKANPLLNNHQLEGKFKGYRSINVGGDWRAVFEESQKGGAFFILFGTHSQLYK